jgi:hypothetical protein
VSGFREWSAFEPFVEHRNGVATLHGHGVRGFPGSMVKRRRWKRLHYSWRHQRTVDEIDAASDLAAVPMPAARLRLLMQRFSQMLQDQPLFADVLGPV